MAIAATGTATDPAPTATVTGMAASTKDAATIGAIATRVIIGGAASTLKEFASLFESSAG